MKSLHRETALMLATLGCVALYLILVTYQRDDLAGQLQLERRRREQAEDDARKDRHNLDGALETIHELRAPDEPDDA